jgi:CHAT domain-containing protein/tetratricopeptide (TPR) repeat protein
LSIFNVICDGHRVGVLLPDSLAEVRDLEQRLACSKSQPLLEGAASKGILVQPCRTKSNGIPYGVIKFQSAGRQWLVEVPPTVLSAAASLAGLSTVGPDHQKTLSSRIPVIWGAEVPLLKAAQITRMRTMLRDSRLANQMGQYEEAESLNRELLGIQIQLGGDDTVLAAETLLDLGLNISNQGRYDEANAVFRRAENILASSTLPDLRARLRSYRSLDAANKGDFKLALTLSEDASRAWRALQADPAAVASSSPTINEAGRPMGRVLSELTYALHLEAAMLLRNNEPQRAYERAGDALRQSQSVAEFPREWQAEILMTLGEAAMSVGRMAAAEEFFRTAQSIRESVFGPTMPSIRTLIILARAFHAEGLDTSSVATYRQAFSRMTQRIGARDEFLSSEELQDFVSAAFNLISRENFPQGQRLQLLEEVFFAFQSVRPGVVDRTITRSAVALSEADEVLGPTLRKFFDMERQLSSKRAEMAEQVTLLVEDRDPANEIRLGNEIIAMENTLRELRQEIGQRFPNYANLAIPKPLSLSAMQAQLKPEEAFVSFLLGRKTSFALLVKRDGLHLAKIPLGEPVLAEMVAKIRKSLAPDASGLPDFPLIDAFELYQVTVAPLSVHLKDVKHLIIHANGVLASLPFSILTTNEPGAADVPNPKTSWLIKRHAISYAPSLHGFVALRGQAKRKTAASPFLGVGNPVLSGTKGPTTSALDRLAGNCRSDQPAPAEQIRALATLPDTESEIKSVAKALAPSVKSPWRFGVDAREESIRGLPLDQYRVLYFATHALLPGELRCQSEPALVLTPPQATSRSRQSDGLLQASEIANLRLNADLVVLSACNTAGAGRGKSGEALSGLAESFFYAGARGLVVSHWQVPSAPTAKLMGSLFSRFGGNQPRSTAEALQAAQVSMSSESKMAHPFYWGAFVVVGDGSRTIQSVKQ